MPAQKLTWDALEAKENSILSPAYISNGHVFTAGQVGADFSTGEFVDSVEDQTELAIVNLKKVLEASGSSLDKVIKVLLFVSQPLYAAVVNKIYAKYFPQSPARSCVVVLFPNPAVKVELEAIATTD